MTWPTPAFLSMVAATLLSVSSGAFAQLATTQPAGGEPTDVPVRAVVLYSSGVGYFEHYGVVKGNAASELRFKSAQINDILKSLVLQDLDGGKISTITYPSQDPVEKTLRSFQVNITTNPPLADLLNQLRGAKVELTVGGEKVAGTVLGVEKKTLMGADKQVVETFKVNLITGTGANIKSLSLDNVSDIALQDAKLQQELGKALAALAQARDQEKKPVQINFTGQGDRHVRVGYVVETPIWKTSYRLVLSSDAKERPKLQGWAIVENQTDNDWNNVELSLVSGRPISFIQDLYRPLYIPRPLVQPQLYASLRPQTYDAGVDADGDGKKEAAGADFNNAPSFSLGRQSRGGGGGGGMGGGGVWRDAGGGGRGGGGAAPEEAKPMDMTASIASAASATKLGELFQYTVGSVSLPRQRSAMIPIVADDVEVERLSIYNYGVLAKNPLIGARLKNTTKDQKHLLEGPITVFVDSRYAGDARIDNLPPGQERLLSYGIDLEVNVVADATAADSAIRTARVDRGVMVIVVKQVYTQRYQVENKSAREKTLLLEHAINPGKDAVVTPKPLEKTESVYRFKETLAPNASRMIDVKEEVIQEETLDLRLGDLMALDYYTRAPQIPEKVRKAIAQAMDLKRGAVELERQIQAKEKDLARIPADQTRIRENMKVVDKATDYYTDLLKKLRAQETELETLTGDAAKLRGDLESQKKKLEDFLKDLTL
ncbi:MAG: hypothetical protein JWN40_713 [Phycisphaerales bacterium]|nr:hypothetical protein [Phycisphaerales bacterium]